MPCPNCGKENQQGGEFCVICGHALTAYNAPVSAPRESPVTRAEQAVGKSWYEKWWGMFILVLFTGFLGAVALYFTWRSSLPKAAKWLLTGLAVSVSWYLQVKLAG